MKTLLQRTLVLLLLTGAAMSQIGNMTNGTTLDDDLDIYASSTEEMELGSMSLSLSNDTTMGSMSTSTPIDLAPTSTDTALTGMFSSTATVDDQVNATDVINATDVANATDSMEPTFTELPQASISSTATLNEIPSILSSSTQFPSSTQVTLDELASSTVFISSPDVVASTASLADTSSPMVTSSPAAVTTASSIADISSPMMTTSSPAAPSQTSETLLVSSPVPSNPLSLSSAVYSSIANTVVVFPTDELSFSEGLTSQIPSPSVTSTITLLSTSKHSSSIATSSYTTSTSTISTTTLPTPSPFSSELLSRSESSFTTFATSTASTAPTTSTAPTISTASTPTESSTDSVILWAPIGGGVFLLVLIVIACMVITGIIVLRSRRKQKGKKRGHQENTGGFKFFKRKQKNKKPNGYWESVNANRHLGSAANVTMGHIAPLPRPNQVSRISLVSRGHYQLDNLSKPLSVQELEQCIRYYGNLHDQYMSIPANMTSMNEIPSGAQEKNRYCDVLPNPNSRVVLFLKFGIANSDYINANFIRGYRGQAKAYIATQGPLPFTVADFWRMIWEQRSTVIIMTTGLIERNMVKCDQYWPDTQGYGVTETYGDIQVTVRKKTGHGDYTLTTFLVQHLERRVTREVAHYWYTKWPDMGVPDNPSSVVDFLLETRRSRESFTMPGPTVVHCSAGIGRTGVFIAADIGMRELEETHAIDILRIVANMRQDRGGMVQTKDQYVFLHRILYEYAKRIGYVAPRMQDMNDFFDERYESEDELDGHIETTTFV